jgi:hypothetical protein
VKRLSLDCKATVKIGPFSRGGQTRGDHEAGDHDFGRQGSYIPFGIVDEDTGELCLSFGSSYKTSDFIVDSLQAWWARLGGSEQGHIDQLQLKIDNGSESSGVRTQFLHRMVQFADAIGKPIQLLYYPPYHSKVISEKEYASSSCYCRANQDVPFGQQRIALQARFDRPHRGFAQ